jgi:hypothetical protein
MSLQLNDTQRKEIRILQYLSMLFLNEEEKRSEVSSRQIAQYLGMHAFDVEGVLYKMSRYGFVTVGFSGLERHPRIMHARIDQKLWDRNRSPLSAFYAHYVTNAPASLRNAYSQKSIVPTRGCPALPAKIPSRCNTTMTSNHNGVVNPYKTETFCCPVIDIPPVEICLLVIDKIDRNRLFTENLIALQKYRILLLGLYSFGIDGMPFSEWLDRGSSPGASRLYCLAETDDSILSSHSPNFSMTVASGGPPLGPMGKSSFAIHTSSDAHVYTVNPASEANGTLESKGISVRYRTLGQCLNGSWILGIEGRLP